MIKKLRTFLVPLAIVALLSGAFVLFGSDSHVALADANQQITKGLNEVNDGSKTDLTAFIKQVINMVLFIVGIAAVVTIIIGGIKYITSSGDQGQVTSAKNTIMYAVIGLVVAILAYAIVNFVVTSIK